jgi:hypothetical protein
VRITFEMVKDWVKPEDETFWTSGETNERSANAGMFESNYPSYRRKQFSGSQIQKLQAMGYSEDFAWQIVKVAGPARAVYAAWWVLTAVRDVASMAEARSGFPKNWAHILLLGVMKEMTVKLPRTADRRGDYKPFFENLGCLSPKDSTDHPSVYGYNKVIDAAILVLEHYGFHQHLEPGRREREKQVTVAAVV